MANAFDTDLAATTEPGEIVAGDTLIWKRADLGADYSNASYTLSYKARLEGTGATVITIVVHYVLIKLISCRRQDSLHSMLWQTILCRTLNGVAGAGIEGFARRNGPGPGLAFG